MKDIISLQKEIKALKSVVAKQEEELLCLKRLNDWYIEQLKLRQKEKFGKSSEKAADDNQLSLFDLFNEAETLREPIVTEPGEETVIKAHKRKKRGRGESVARLPVQRIEYTLGEEERICPDCKSVLSEMKTEIRKEITIIPAQVYLVEHVTHVYSCRSCDREGTGGEIRKAPSPKALLPKSLVSPSLMAYIMNQKYANAMPLYRQEQEFKRLGVELSRQNLSNWVLKGAARLTPLFEEMKKELLNRELLHADETRLEVLKEPGRDSGCNSYMWLYRTSMDTTRPVIAYDYQIGRSGDYAKAFLKGWTGKYLHCDGYSGYKKLEGVTLCGCFAHAKRKFHEAHQGNPGNEEAKRGESYIQKLFAIEHKADRKSYKAEDRLTLRQKESAKVLEEFYEWIEEITPKTLPQSLLGKALTYAKNQRVFLSSFLKDGRIQLTNNLSEQAIKMFVIGRKNWLFSNTANGAKASAVIYSILQTAIANKLRPLYYLEHCLEQIQLRENLPMEELLPWSEKLPERCRNQETLVPES